MRRYRTVLIIALMALIPMIATVFLLRFIFPATEPEQPQSVAPVQQTPPPVEEPEERRVLTAARSLAVGTLLAEEDLLAVAIGADMVRGWHIDVESLDRNELPYGYAVRERIAEGAAVSWSSIVGPRQRGFLAAVLKPGMRAITIRLGTGIRHSGLVDPGDRVDVVLTARSRDGGAQNVLARTILEDVRVLAIDRQIVRVAGTAGDGDEVERAEIATATLEVLPSQTSLLAMAEFDGELTLAVRSLAPAGTPSGLADLVDMHSLLSPPEDVVEPELEPQSKMVRVIRGVDIVLLPFGDDLELFPSPIAEHVPGLERPGRDTDPLNLDELDNDAGTRTGGRKR